MAFGRRPPAAVTFAPAAEPAEAAPDESGNDPAASRSGPGNTLAIVASGAEVPEVASGSADPWSTRVNIEAGLLDYYSNAISPGRPLEPGDVWTSANDPDSSQSMELVLVNEKIKGTHVYHHKTDAGPALDYRIVNIGASKGIAVEIKPSDPNDSQGPEGEFYCV